MQYKIFTVHGSGDEQGLADLNQFLRSHRILSVTKTLLSDGLQGVWNFCVEYGISNGDSNTPRPKIDYKEVLDDETFAKYDIYRRCRKIVTERAGVPPYAFLPNEQLAELAKLPELTESAIKSLSGVGDKKFEAYGRVFLKLVEEEMNETNREPVSENSRPEQP